MYSRVDLPSRYHKFYMLAYDATNCLSRVPRTKSAQPAPTASKEARLESADSKLTLGPFPKQQSADPQIKTVCSAEQRGLSGPIPRPNSEKASLDLKPRNPGHTGVYLNKSLYRKEVIQPF